MISTIIILMLLAANFGLVVAKNGQQREDKYDAGMSFFVILVWLSLLYGAGLFDKFF